MSPMGTEAVAEAPESKVVDVVFTSDTARGAGSLNTKLLLNGQNITKFTHRFTLSADVHGVVTADIGIYPTGGFVLELPALVSLVAEVRPGCVLIEETTETGKRWRVERAPLDTRSAADIP